MFEKDTAYLAVEMMGLITRIFQNNLISLTEYISNTKHKALFLEDYIKKNKDSLENNKIIKTLLQHNLLLKAYCSASN